MQNVNISTNGLPVVSAEFEILRGTRSGKGFVLISDKNYQDKNTIDLKFDDGEKSVELSNLLVLKSTRINSNDNEGLLKLEIADNREKWKNLRVSGSFNVTEANGIRYKSDTLNNNVEYTLKELIELCFEKTDSTVDCSLRVLNDVKPKNIFWDNKLLTDALDDLLALGDVSIVLKHDGSFVIKQRTVSGSVEYNQNIIALETIDAQNSIEVPNRIRIVGAKTWREKELAGSWEPVCISDGTNGKVDGSIYPLSLIAGDWGLSIADIKKKCLYPGGFRDIPGSDDEKRKRRQLLQRCAFKWYRYTGTSDQLPWLTHRAETDAEGKPLPIPIKHTFFRLNRGNSQAFSDPFENVSTPTVSSYAYEVDCANGIIKFRNVQGVLAPVTGDVDDTRLEGRSLASGASIEATVAWELSASDPDPRYTYEKEIVGGKGSVFELRRDDLRLRQIDNGSSVADLNFNELETFAEEIASEIVRRFHNPVIKRVKYAGCYVCDASGAVKSVKYHASSAQGFTTVVEIVNIPDLPSDVILQDEIGTRTDVDSSGEERDIKQVNAYSVGPVVIKADDAVLPESMSFAKASGTPGNMKLQNLGIMRNPFFWDRDNEVGGWFALSLASVITGTHPYYMVKESDEQGTLASGAKGLDITNLQDSKLDMDDLVIVFETHNGHKVAFPLNKTLMCDHKQADEAQDNKSTEVSNADVDDEKIGDFDDIFWIKRDAQDIARLMLNIQHEGPQAFYTGDNEDSAVAVLGGKSGVLIAPKDCELHVLGQNKDKEPVIEGHITTEANYYQDRIGDGPIKFVQSIRDMGEDLLGKFQKADMWWDYDQNMWIPWYQTLWEKIPPITPPPPTYPPTDPPYTPPVTQPVDQGAVITPSPNATVEAPQLGEEDASYLGCCEIPWRGLVLGDYNENESLPGIIMQGGDCYVVFKVPKNKSQARVKFDEGVNLEIRENLKIEKNLEVEGEITGGNASDSWLRRDGQNSPAANIDWGGFQIQNVCHIQQNDNCRHYFGDSNDAAVSYDPVLDCLKIEGKDLCAAQKVKTQDKFSVAGNDGLSGVLSFDDGVNDSITLTFAGGILVGHSAGNTSGLSGISFQQE